MNTIDKAVELLAPVDRLVVTTGAGMSKESGIPTFRDAPSALWANYNPEELATPEGFANNPPLVWEWYVERQNMMKKTTPHAGHYAVAEMESMFDQFELLTQNIDNLHHEAGSSSLVELHGNIFRYKCFDHHHPVSELPKTDEKPPRCVCGSFIRPDVVWFGEQLGERDIERSFEVLSTCEAILVIGTSGIVYPVAGFPGVAKSAGARVVEVNPEQTPITALADVFVEAPAGKAIPAMVEKLKEARKNRR